ncbi:hypothetical protein EVJ58_g3490 [Rhodofomes roseus]|uniref:Cytochrome P450 n=1 Tax=Rhodofomes roseus TaxID=34475 RepID=A0A4Y9YNC4_9APHY|nr:hypothetical protein EVJ58_g3490 [Rhodofomes roseus]
MGFRSYRAGYEPVLSTFVRLAPNHVSISDPKALPAIYGHSAGFMKSEFYDVFGPFTVSNIFTTRSRTEHARKRHMEAHMFAPQSIRAIEPISHSHVSELLRQWDYLVSRVKEAQGVGPRQGLLGSAAWTVEDGRVWFNAMDWCNYWAFDTIGDLAFGYPFGMLKSGRDIARVAKNPEEGFKAIEKMSQGCGELSIEEEEIPYIEILTVTTATRRPVKKLAALATMAVARRMANLNSSGRPDMLQKLLEVRDDEGNPLKPEELGSEVIVLIVAGSDTIANTTCGTIYYLAREKRVQARLQEELDAALADVDSDVVPYDVVKDLPYLEAVILEGQRLHSTVGAGLPRVVPAGGATVLGHHFKEGTCLSVPLYHLHRDESIWGPDAPEFRPERWIEASQERKKEMTAAFAPFSVGPRACIGRNLAIMQLHIIFSTLFRRYDCSLKPGAPPSRDSFARRPLNCVIGINRRKH